VLLHNQLDHIAIGALNLDEGADFIKSSLDIDIPVGGEHRRMGTHNCLMSLGGDLGDEKYLEVIAVNPDAEPPASPRWFGLDSDEQQESLSNGPKPIAWVMRTNHIENTLSRARKVGIDLGKPLEMTRGSLRWTIAVRGDGLLPEAGTLPVVIQWSDGLHPANAMQDFGYRLNAVRLSHPQPQELAKKLKALDADHLVTIETSPGDSPHIGCELVSSTGKLISL